MIVSLTFCVAAPTVSITNSTSHRNIVNLFSGARVFLFLSFPDGLSKIKSNKRAARTKRERERAP